MLRSKALIEKMSLYSYLNVCVDVGQMTRALNSLLKHSKSRTDVLYYNIILRGWAKMYSPAQVLETRMYMIKNNVEPNAESFAFILLANAKVAKKDSIRKIVDDLQARGMDSRHLFRSTYLNPQERDSVKKMLQSVNPKYDDMFPDDDPIDYNCKLLKHFGDSKWEPFDFSGIKDASQLEWWAKNQRHIENKSSISIKSIATVKGHFNSVSKYSRIWLELKDNWRKNMIKALEENLQILQKQSITDKIHLYPYLCSVDKDMLVNMMLDVVETNAHFTNYSASTNVLHSTLGNKVMTRYLKAKAIADGSYYEKMKLYNEYLREYCTNPVLVASMTPREFIQKKALQTKNYVIFRERLMFVEEWPNFVITAVGRFLYGIILKEVKFDPDAVRNPKKEINKNNLVNAFYTAYFQVDGSHKIKEEFRSHLLFDKLLKHADTMHLTFDYSYLPCSSPPMPWLSRRFGGYLTNKSELVRLCNSPFNQHINNEIKSTENQKLYPSLDSLNSLGLCPWIVNKEILDLVIHLFREGGALELNVPLEESKMLVSTPKLKDNPTKTEKILYYKEKKKHDQKQREMYSLWRDLLYRLSIANHFRDKMFWFPHNMDFRGRTYPIAPHFNHLGNDLARSLLLFAKGRPLGEKGLDWLKIHLINLYGSMKRAPLKERLDYANSILQLEILDSADNPWDGRRWWTNTENPWQVLACCKEIARAVRSGDHTRYVSHFPVHQDGSCNGLQHYAALGRDPGGALAVNLIPSDKPQDVYSRVVELVEEMRKKDAEKGLKIAISLEGHIKRKVIKQTVMTTVYGVTRFGARHQIARQLNNKKLDDREIWHAAQYLTTKTFESIGQMFSKSRQIQDWLNNCAYIIASRCNRPVSWETPLGFTIVQPYARNRYQSTKLFANPIDASQQNYDQGLNTTKQKTAFPPNYIHSLDSSHMMLTSLYCQRMGITFVSIHDCYWTHPSTVDRMNEICRQQFIALHSEPLLKDLSEQFMHKYGKLISEGPSKLKKKHTNSNNNNLNPINNTNVSIAEHPSNLQERLEVTREASHNRMRDTIMDVPETGELDLSTVEKSVYFFS